MKQRKKSGAAIFIQKIPGYENLDPYEQAEALKKLQQETFKKGDRFARDGKKEDAQKEYKLASQLHDLIEVADANVIKKGYAKHQVKLLSEPVEPLKPEYLKKLELERQLSRRKEPDKRQALRKKLRSLSGRKYLAERKLKSWKHKDMERYIVEEGKQGNTIKRADLKLRFGRYRSGLFSLESLGVIKRIDEQGETWRFVK